MKAHIPQDVYSINKIFRSAGFELYLVGGAVRNLVLGSHPTDWDLASNAQPHETMALFSHVIPTGIQHGTVTIRFRKKSYEVTTFRIDGDYSDSRHPDNVEYTANIHEDLKRRDFTINAMAYDLHAHQLLDPHGGQEDLRRKTIKTVGNPLERFSEDGLRIIRGLRFASTLNFSIHEDTYRAMKERRNYFQTVSIERIRDEFNKILHSPRPSLGIGLAADIEVLQCFIPQLSTSRKIMEAADKKTLFDRLLASCDYAPQNNLELRFAALLHDISKISSRKNHTPASQAQESADVAQTLCRKMKYPRSFEKRVHRLIKNHALPTHSRMSDAEIRRFVSTIGSDLILDLLSLKKASLAGCSGPFVNQNQNGVSLSIPPIPWIDTLEKSILDILDTNPALNISDLAVNGHELHSLAGIPKTSEMKDILNHLLNSVIEDPDMNKKDRLIQSAQTRYQQIHNRTPQ